MSKRKSLSILVHHSFLLTDESKKKILNNLQKLSDDEVAKLGLFLALEKKKSLEENF